MKKIRIILLVIILILVVLAGILIAYSTTNNKQEENEDYSETQTLKDVLYPENFSEIHLKYKGSNNVTKIYKKLYAIAVEGIPQLSADINNLDTEDKIREYYKNNEYIKNNLGQESYIELKNIVDYIKTFETMPLQYTSSEIEEGSAQVFTNRIEFTLNITYNSKQTLKFNVQVYNDKKENFVKIVPLRFIGKSKKPK